MAARSRDHFSDVTPSQFGEMVTSVWRHSAFRI